jgi:hypothetical protein
VAGTQEGRGWRNRCDIWTIYCCQIGLASNWPEMARTQCGREGKRLKVVVYRGHHAFSLCVRAPLALVVLWRRKHERLRGGINITWLLLTMIQHEYKVDSRPYTTSALDLRTVCVYYFCTRSQSSLLLRRGLGNQVVAKKHAGRSRR